LPFGYGKILKEFTFLKKFLKTKRFSNFYVFLPVFAYFSKKTPFFTFFQEKFKIGKRLQFISLGKKDFFEN
jgi:hypothetical protein